MKMTDLDQSVQQDITEGWSQKYKSSINCSHPKGFSQKAHCAGKKKHTESVETEMTCPDCGMCKTHGNINEIAKGAKDSNGFTKCWPGKHAEGTKKGKNGGQVRNCVPNESQGVAEAAKWRSHPDAYDVDDEGNKTPRNPNSPQFGYDPLQRRAATANDAKTPRGKTTALKTSLKMAKGNKGVAKGDKKPYPKTWHDVDPNLGKQVDNMSQAEKVEKGLAHPDTLKKQGVAEAFENDESNLMYRFNPETGRLGQRMIHNNEEQVAHRQGYRDSHESALKAHGIVRSKFKPGKWVQKQGNSWTEVFPYGKPTDVEMDEALPLDQLRKAAGVKATNPFANAPKPIEPIKPAQIPTGPVDLNQFKPKNESATAGGTSAANVGVGAVYNNKPPKQPKNKDGTAKNAVDMKGVNLLTGGSLKR